MISVGMKPTNDLFVDSVILLKAFVEILFLKIWRLFELKLRFIADESSSTWCLWLCQMIDSVDSLFLTHTPKVMSLRTPFSLLSSSIWEWLSTVSEPHAWKDIFEMTFNFVSNKFIGTDGIQLNELSCVRAQRQMADTSTDKPINCSVPELSKKGKALVAIQINK